MLNKKIYIPYDKTDGVLPENAIIKNKIIYAEFNEKTINNDNEKCKNLSESADCIKSKLNNKEKNKRNKNIKSFEKKKNKSNANHSSDAVLEEKIKNRTEEESIFKNLRKYYYIIEDNKIMKYSVNKCN